MSEHRIPLFPLNTVLFPGGVLPLRIFEPRYLDMISACLRNNTPFGVALIREGVETGKAAITYDLGTLVNIDYFHTLNDGVLGITARGHARFRIYRRSVQPDQLVVAEVETLANEPAAELPAHFRPLAEMLSGIMQQLGQPYMKLKPCFDDASWVGARLTELLPIGLDQKQYFLLLDDPIQRLERLEEVLKTLDSD
ncbi:MAG: LON peptidase substrate-binding domain-containing protein [Gammaproteobacteria bacterium]|nr:LON peptidase substrate-binding domain-containing protein [Gammaproteobacteria bacterium]